MAAAQATPVEQGSMLVLEAVTTQAAVVVDQAAQVATLHQVFKEQVAQVRLVQ
jgi:hypothetical protein